MNHKATGILILLLLAAPVFAEDLLKAPKDQRSYAMGVNMLGNLKQQGIDYDLELVVRGMRDAQAGGKLLMSDEDIRKQISFYQRDLRNKQAKSRTAASLENRKKGLAFLAANAKEKGVVTLPSGLQYRVLKAGEGAKKPTDADTAEFHYRTSSITGEEYESSHHTGKPALRKVKGGMIPGLSEALKLMTVGSRWQLFLPPQLAYGEKGSGTTVEPGETVVFEVELLAVK